MELFWNSGSHLDDPQRPTIQTSEAGPGRGRGASPALLARSGINLNAGGNSPWPWSSTMNFIVEFTHSPGLINHCFHDFAIPTW